jgi:hypothetical protein
VNFAFVLSKRLKARGHEVLLTTRRYREIIELVKIRGVKAKEIGEFGGATLEGKLKASVRRLGELVGEISAYQPDVGLSFGSPEAARILYGLGIPHFCIIDSPHAESVCRLTIPLSKKVIAPKVIPIGAWRKYGATPNMVVRYDALDPIVWIRELKPDRSVLNQMDLNPSNPIIVFRLEEQFASYLLSMAKGESVMIPILKNLMSRLDESVQLVALARYDEQVPALLSLGHRIRVPEKPVDGFSLLSYTSLFVGAGGTMTAESALMGVPTISYYPGRITYVEQYLIKRKLVRKCVSVDEALKTISSMLENLEAVREEQKHRAGELINEMQDPVETICEVINA